NSSRRMRIPSRLVQCRLFASTALETKLRNDCTRSFGTTLEYLCASVPLEPHLTSFKSRPPLTSPDRENSVSSFPLSGTNPSKPSSTLVSLQSLFNRPSVSEIILSQA